MKKRNNGLGDKGIRCNALRTYSTNPFIPLSLILLLFITSCASKESKTGYYKVGAPYQIKNEWYHPKEDHNYDEVGISSWYGSEFHNKKTANGGIFNRNALTAAHRTLPLPSIVRVTNLENNRSIVLTVNDRGPFSKKRILDVSEKAAEKLGFKNKGTTKVRVQFLPEETKKLLPTIPGANDKASAIKNSNPSAAIADDSTNAAPVNKSTKTVNTSGHYIQAGTFSMLDNAKNVEKKLSSVGNASIIPVTANGKSMYKVKIGPISNKEESQNTLNKIKSLGFNDAILTNK